MTVYTITNIARLNGPLRPIDLQKLGKQVRIIALKIGEPAVFNYVDDPTWTIETPEVLDFGLTPTEADMKRDLEAFIESYLYLRKLRIECESITYTLDEFNEKGTII